ncbi:MAG TPA: XRE family transcriptional regulator [Thermomicrobiales bacterium]|nr:XRE family transcriptional regulator [Thermomicrobiales bacterium]
MTATTRQLDDLDQLIAILPDEERAGLVAADAAIDLAFLIYRARERRGLTQAEAAKLAGLHQQAVSRNERVHIGMKIETLRHYLAALGYRLEITVRDVESDEIVESLALPVADCATTESPSPKAGG